MKIYVIRHGQTEWNVKRLLQGQIDIGLNETGIAQATEAREEIKKHHFDVCFCSPKLRAKQTAELVLKGTDVPVIYDARLREREFGEADGKPYDKENTFGMWEFGQKPIYKGMESPEEVLGRVKEFFEEIYKDYKDKSVLVSTHGGLSMAIAYYFLGVPENNDFTKYLSKNCEIKKFEM